MDIQIGVWSSICAVSGRQTVVQKDSIVALYQHQDPLMQEAGLPSHAPSDPPSQIVKEDAGWCIENAQGYYYTRAMFMVLSSWLRVHLVHAINAEQRQVAADLWTKSIGLSHKPACRGVRKLHPPPPFIITQLERWQSFYHPTEGRRLSRPRWFVKYPDGLPAASNDPSKCWLNQHVNHYTTWPPNASMLCCRIYRAFRNFLHTQRHPRHLYMLHAIGSGSFEVNLSSEMNQAVWRHAVSPFAAVVVALSALSYTLTHNLQPTQTCCRCLHSRRSRTPHTDLMNSRTSNVERSRSMNLPPSPAENTCLYQMHAQHQRINVLSCPKLLAGNTLTT